MANEQPTDSSKVAVLFADVVGSTKLYEDHGDANAREALAHCVQVMLGVTSRYKGRLKKTIGDEVMVAFDQPMYAVLAANELHIAVRNASEAGEFVTGSLRIKIGFHYDVGIETATDVSGPAGRLAQQIINYSKPDQILSSRPTLAEVPSSLTSSSRHFDDVTIEGTSDRMEVIELLWEVSDATQMVGTPSKSAQPVVERSLTLSYNGQTFQLDKSNPHLTIGRVAANDLMVPTDLTSRNHAEIEYKNGNFYLADMSSNGTVIVDARGQQQQLRREGAMLKENGQICFGGVPRDNPTGLVEFEID